jgi:MFS transporter, DHA2 family, multidrug resistance protein
MAGGGLPPGARVHWAGAGLFLVPTLFYATRDVLPQQGPTAAASFNLSRIVGQTFGTAVLGSLITEREKFHSAVLVDSITSGTGPIPERLAALRATFERVHGDAGLAGSQAWSSLSATLSNQAFVLAFADAFFIRTAVSALLVLMLPPLHAPNDRTSERKLTPPLLQIAQSTKASRDKAPTINLSARSYQAKTSIGKNDRPGPTAL